MCANDRRHIYTWHILNDLDLKPQYVPSHQLKGQCCTLPNEQISLTQLHWGHLQMVIQLVSHKREAFTPPFKRTQAKPKGRSKKTPVATETCQETGRALDSYTHWQGVGGKGRESTQGLHTSDRARSTRSRLQCGSPTSSLHQTSVRWASAVPKPAVFTCTRGDNNHPHATYMLLHKLTIIQRWYTCVKHYNYRYKLDTKSKRTTLSPVLRRWW